MNVVIRMDYSHGARDGESRHSFVKSTSWAIRQNDYNGVRVFASPALRMLGGQTFRTGRSETPTY